jgi:hypothetical protein
MESKVHKRKEVTTMKYETPDVTALTPAIIAIQGSGVGPQKDEKSFIDSRVLETVPAYSDWED